MSKQIEFYKKHRELLQFGNYYVTENCFDNERYFGYITVSENKDEAMMMVAELAPHVRPHLWRTKGLDLNSNYHVVMRPQYNLKKEQLIDVVVSGKDLMKKGLDLGELYSTTDKELYNGIYSRLLYIKKE